MKRVFISLGDISARNYIYEIFKEGFENFEIFGLSDEKLESIGIKKVEDFKNISVVGIAEVIPKIFKIRKIFKKVLESLKNVDVLIVCDAPGFNLRLIKEAKRSGVKKVIYFISPQVWAWGEGRIKTIVEFSDHIIVILPFEKEIYERYSHKVSVHYVGHPLVDMVRPVLSEEEFRRKFDLYEDFINIMPGSRWSEIKRHVPLLKELINFFERRKLLSVIPTFEEFKKFISENIKSERVKIITEEDIPYPSYPAMHYSKFSVIASGTASLEASISLNPHMVFYKVNPITYLIGKKIVKVPYISLPNIILNRKVVPELINTSLNELISEAEKFLSDERILKAQRESFKEIKNRLGNNGVIERLRKLFLNILSD